MQIVVGSRALECFNLLHRNVDDIDVWTDDEEVFKSSLCDCSLIPTNILKMIPTVDNHATPEAILAIKMSHFGFDILWEKHKKDILWLKSNGIEPIMELYQELKSFWKEKHGNKDFLSLYKDKTEFFNDFVDYEFDHDYLHELVAYPNKPMYTRCHKDGEEVMIDQKKFFNMPFCDQVRMFREEIAVIALERWLLNPRTTGKVSIATAHAYSLRKTVTSLTKNWATDFLVENIERFIVPDRSYYKHTIKTLNRGELNMQKVKDVEQLLEDISQHAKEVGYDLYIEDEEEGVINLSELVLECDEFGDFKILESDYAGEGSGENHHYVFSFKGKVYKVLYQYFSHYGCEFDNDEVYEVKPIEKVVTFYE